MQWIVLLVGSLLNVIMNLLGDFCFAALWLCQNGVIEPVLQPLSGEAFHYATANVEGETRLDVSAQGVFLGGRGVGNAIRRLFLSKGLLQPQYP